MTENLHIRNAQREDLDKIVSIYNSTIASRMVTADTEPITVMDRIDWFDAHNEFTRPLWIAEEQGETVGWISFQSFYGRPAYQHTAEISIYLDVKHRGKGLGRQLLAYSIGRCKGLNIHNLLGFIFAHNHPSIKLFRSLDFSEWAHLPGIAEIEGEKLSLKILGKKID